MCRRTELFLSLYSCEIRPFDTAVILNKEAEEHIGIGSESGDWVKDMQGINETFRGSGGEFLVGHLNEKMVVMGSFKVHSLGIAKVLI